MRLILDVGVDGRWVLVELGREGAWWVGRRGVHVHKVVNNLCGHTTGSTDLSAALSSNHPCQAML